MNAIGPFGFELLPLGSVYLMTAGLSSAGASPGEWAAGGIAIACSFLAGVYAARKGLLGKTPKSKLIREMSRSQSRSKDYLRIRLVILLIYVMAMLDIGFTQIEVGNHGVGIESNHLARPFIMAGPTGTTVFRLGVAAFCCGLLMTLSHSKLVRNSLKLILVAHVVLMIYWSIWYSVACGGAD